MPFKLPLVEQILYNILKVHKDEETENRGQLVVLQYALKHNHAQSTLLTKTHKMCSLEM